MFNCVVQSLCELLVEICSVFLSVLCQNSQLVLLFVFVFVKIVLHPFECAVYVICPLYNVFKYINIQSHKIEYLLCVFCPRSLSSLYCCILLSLHSCPNTLKSTSLRANPWQSCPSWAPPSSSSTMCPRCPTRSRLVQTRWRSATKKTFATESDQLDVFV